jgi:NAD(P)-dependent dehydrogenase (short-subunit alcohol dehydrogenase family)
MLNGKVAVVTGAARGVGRAASIALAESGADVVGIDICAAVDPKSGVMPAKREELEDAGCLVGATGRRWRSFVLAQRDLSALRNAAGDIEPEFSNIDILFANAGIQAFTPLLEMEDADWPSRLTLT